MTNSRWTGFSTSAAGAGSREGAVDDPDSLDLRLVLPAGVPAFAAAMASLAICYGSLFAANLLGVEVPHILNPHVQAVLMWGFALMAVCALWRDRKRHGSSIPLVLSVAALAILVAILYLEYDTRIETFSYVLLTIAALLNWIILMRVLNRTVRDQAREIAALNRSLKREVEDQGHEIGRLARLRQFLAPQIADLVVSEGADSLLSTHRRYIACLFCDIRQFTSLSEDIEPEEIMTILQNYHDEIGQLVTKYRGTIGFRAGDGLMVFFNDPIPCEEPVLDAVRLALEVRAAFERIRAPWLALGHLIGVGIGIASGYATLGLVGLQGRADYTAIGSVVNIASRLCDKAADGQILLNQRAYRDVEPRIRAERLGSFDLKGVRNTAQIYELLALDETKA